MGTRIAPATAAVLWLHDLGEQRPSGFRDVVGHSTPWLEVVCPAAPRQMVTCRIGEESGSSAVPAWFDITSHLPVDGKSDSFEGIDDAIKSVHARLDDLLMAMDLAPSRVVIAGFGQGGALAITAGLAYRQKLAGILCHSGWVDLRGAAEHVNLSTCANRDTPLMIIHGNEDDFAAHDFAREGADRLRGAGMKEVIFKSFEGLEHKMRNDSANLTLDFLRGRLPAIAPPAKKAEEVSGAVGAKSKTVIKMNRRGSGPKPEPVTTAAAPPSDAVTTAPELEPVTTGAKTAKGTGVGAAAEPMRRAAGAPEGGSDTDAAAQPPKRAAAGPADPGGVSSDAATAKALREGDADALRKALEKRGDDSPLSQEEMLAIAQLMLGADASTEFGKGLAMGLASGPEAAAEAWQRGQTKAPQVSKPPPQAADEDSDDGEWEVPSKIKDNAENDEEKEHGTAAQASQPARAGEPAAKKAPPALSAAEWEAKAEAALARARGESATPTAVATTPTKSDEPKADVQSSTYTLIDEGSSMRLLVKMPAGVTSMAQVEVDLSSTRVAISVDGEVYADVALPRAVDDDSAGAKFSKKAAELRVTAPWA